MSDSAKKKLKQMRLPFAIIAAESGTVSPKAAENSPQLSASRKRKQSNDGDNTRSNKIVRVVESKENIAAEPDVDQAADSDQDLLVEVEEEIAVAKPAEAEKTPTAAAESVLHIKLPSCSKSKRKINMDVKPRKSIDEEDEDDSVVYLDDEEVQGLSKKLKKSAKKSKKKKGSQSAVASIKKALNLSGGAPGSSETNAEVILISDSESYKNESESSPKEACSEGSPSSAESPDRSKMLEEDNELQEEKIECLDTIKTIPSSSTSPKAVEPEEIIEEIMEMLSDDSESNQNTSMDPAESGRTPTSGKFDLKSLTPKQLARRQELESRRLEKELQRQRERDLKEQQRLKEKEQREEAKRKEKEEKEEARKKEKEERDRKRQAEQDKKDEEKRLKEEERKRTADQREEEKRQKEEERKRQVEQREEEKRKREEASKQKEMEEENRKKRAAQAFSKFFVAKKKNEAAIVEDETSKDSAASAESMGLVKSSFMPFQIRERMTVAPIVRLDLSRDRLQALDDSLKTSKPLSELYLRQLRSGSHKPKFSEKTLPNDEKEVDDDDVVIVDDLEGVGENIQADLEADDLKIKMKHRAKFFLFIENRRPAYYGTWRKKTSHITARHPLRQDTKFFDYEVDSDDEWEEEGPGESLHGSDSEKEKDAEEDDYEVDNDFFVPHGHLSDEEMQQMGDEDDGDNRPEAQKAKLKILQQEFAAEMKKKTEKIKPRLIGCIWMNGDEDDTGCSKSSNTEKKYHCSDIIWRILKAREMMTSGDEIKMEDDLEPEIAVPEEEVQPKTQAKITEESVKQFIRIIHGNLNNKRFICREFQAYRLKNFNKDSDFQEFSVKSVEEKMMEISEYKTCAEEGAMFGKKCWLVKPKVIQEHFGEHFGDTLKLPNEWIYILAKEVKEKKPKPQATTVEGAKKESPPIEPLKMAEKTSKQTDVKPQATSAPVVKKRVQLLMSVPLNQEFSQTKKNNLLKGNKGENISEESGEVDSEKDVIVID